MRRQPAGRLLLALVLLACLLLQTACQAGPVEQFPTLTAATSASTRPSGTQPTAGGSAGQKVTLHVAAPISAEAAEALRELYIGFQNGSLTRDSQSPAGDRFVPGGVLAAESSLSFDFEFVPVEAVADGKAWRTLSGKGSLPDVFVSGDLGSLLREQALMDLSTLVGRLDIAGAARLPLFAVEALKHNGKVYGVPFLASVPMLIWNPGLLQRLGLEMPASLDADGLLRLLTQTAERLTAEAALPDGLRSSAVADIRPLLEYWPAALDAGLAAAGWQDEPFRAAAAGATGAGAVGASSAGAVGTNGAFRFDHPAVRAVLQLLRSLEAPGLTPTPGLSASGAYDAAAARETFLSGQSVFLIEDSSSLPGLLLQSRVPVNCLLLPITGFKESLAKNSLTGLSESGRQPFRITAWCVSAQTEYPAEAAQLALFLAQDPDALLLLSRYAPQEGWLPLTYAAAVWDRAVVRQSQGKLLKPLGTRLSRGNASPAVRLPSFMEAVRATLMSPELLRADQPPTEAELAALSRTAADRLQNG